MRIEASMRTVAVIHALRDHIRRDDRLVEAARNIVASLQAGDARPRLRIEAFAVARAALQYRVETFGLEIDDVEAAASDIAKAWPS